MTLSAAAEKIYVVAKKVGKKTIAIKQGSIANFDAYNIFLKLFALSKAMRIFGLH